MQEAGVCYCQTSLCLNTKHSRELQGIAQPLFGETV